MKLETNKKKSDILFPNKIYVGIRFKQKRFFSFSIKINKVNTSFAFFWPYFFLITLKAHPSFLAFTFFEIMNIHQGTTFFWWHFILTVL